MVAGSVNALAAFGQERLCRSDAGCAVGVGFVRGEGPEIAKGSQSAGYTVLRDTPKS